MDGAKGPVLILHNRKVLLGHPFWLTPFILTQDLC